MKSKIWPIDLFPIARDGEIILLSTKNRKIGALYNMRRKQVGDRKPLQIFFKWGLFVDLTDKEKQKLEQSGTIEREAQ